MSADECAQRVPFLAAAYDDVTFEDVCAELTKHVESRVPGYMMSLNLDILIRADKDEAFKEALLGSDLILMDSTPLMKIARRRGLSVKEKLSGSDLMPRICAYAAEKSYTCFILGGMSGVPEAASDKLEGSFPGFEVVGTLSPEFGFEQDEAMTKAVIEAVKGANPDFMFLCLGEPKAGMFISSHLDELGVPFTFNVGAAVDFAAGNVTRAPEWMQNAGLEWLYRFAQEPKRLFKRYFVDSWHFLEILKKYGKQS